MAAHERPNTNQDITERLAAVLPLGASFKLYHASTPPERTEPLRPAAPKARPEKTYCENHFLTVSIPHNSEEVFAFAIEIFIYSTVSTTTFFVSKADSTGYLGLVNLPKGISPVKEISSVFLNYLVEKRERPNITSIVSLFARAQDQYLFPGSVDNPGKHVLDDRGLVKWWCKVLDPLVKSGKEASIEAHLLVPGLDKYETLGFLPSNKKNWKIGYPLGELFGSNLPPRCVIPHFPDDPKARFLDELDDEIEGSTNGMWKSVKTLDQFWEMMAYRQECSAGRLVGFIWVILSQRKQEMNGEVDLGDSQITATTIDSNFSDTFGESMPAGSPTTSFYPSSQLVPPEEVSTPKAKSSHRQSKKPKKKLRGPIITRQPKIKTEHRHYHLERPENTPHYTWPQDSRAEVIVEEKEYKRMTELLLHLDFETLDLAKSSSKRWINEVNRDWGKVVIGTKVVEAKTEQPNGVATLNVGLVRKKRKVEDPEPKVNVLGDGMIRKKSKA